MIANEPFSEREDPPDTMGDQERLKLSTFRHVHLGVHKSAQDLQQFLLIKRFSILEPAESMLKITPVATRETTIELVAPTVRQLGLDHRFNLPQIYARAFECGLEKVPAEVGPQLRWQYPEQPQSESLAIGMEPIIAYDGKPHIFVVLNYFGNLTLFGGHEDPRDLLWPDVRWVFARGRQN